MGKSFLVSKRNRKGDPRTRLRRIMATKPAELEDSSHRQGFRLSEEKRSFKASI
jgi:hypothetical protein